MTDRHFYLEPACRIEKMNPRVRLAKLLRELTGLLILIAQRANAACAFFHVHRPLELCVAAEIIVEPVEALPMVAGRLTCDGLQLTGAKLTCITFGLFAGDKFVLHLIGQNGQVLCRNGVVLILYFFFTLRRSIANSLRCAEGLHT